MRVELLMAKMKRLRVAAALCAVAFASSTAHAQTTTYSNTNTTNAAINDNTCGGTPLTRTFSVGTSYTVGDVDLGLVYSHTYRGDVRVTLTSPSGTSVVVANQVGGGADNYNALLSDEAGSAVSGYTANAVTTGSPPYASQYVPSNPLSNFDGQNAQGTWTLAICDNGNGDTGAFVRADLYIAQAGPQADLSVTKMVSNTTPSNGAAISYTVTVTNAASSSTTASGVQVKDLLPPGVTFTGASTANGSYSAATGLWTLTNSLAPGGSATLTINATVNASQGASILNWAEVWASGAPDGDSTPGNDSTTEDDDASATFTVSGTRVAATPPTLVCPAGSTLFDWDTKTWTAGTLNNSYAETGFGNVNWAVQIVGGGSFLSNAALGGQNPALGTTGNTGGLSPVERSLSLLTDLTSQSSYAEVTATWDTPIPGVQFRIFDVDYSAGAYADKITVIGYVNGVSVYPTLSNGSVNWVAGNIAVGDALAGNSEGTGNIWVTFNQPVDTVIVRYGNHTTAPSNPNQQAIALHDYTMCNPNAQVSISKTSSPVSGQALGDFNIPQNDVLYFIAVRNSGSAELNTDSVFVVDRLPPQVTFFNGDANGPSVGGTDPVTFSDSGSGLTWNYATDVRYSNGATAPTSFAQCTYTPVAGYDPNVKYICFNPKGVMNGEATSTYSGFNLMFRAQIK